MAEVVTKTCDRIHARGKVAKPCGDPVTSGSTTLVLDNITYKMDLCDKDKKEMTDALAPFLSVAEQGTVQRAIKRAVFVGPGGKAYTSRDVREYFEEKGNPLPELGRIPNHVLRQYEREALVGKK